MSLVNTTYSLIFLNFKNIDNKLKSNLEKRLQKLYSLIGLRAIHHECWNNLEYSEELVPIKFFIHLKWHTKTVLSKSQLGR